MNRVDLYGNNEGSRKKKAWLVWSGDCTNGCGMHSSVNEVDTEHSAINWRSSHWDRSPETTVAHDIPLTHVTK